MRPLFFENGILKLIDQTRLPSEYVLVECRTYQDTARAIRDMLVRGAPAIGVTAAYGVALGAAAIESNSIPIFFAELDRICEVLRNTRPTAVNLFWAIERMHKTAVENKDKTVKSLQELLFLEAQKMDREDVEANRAIGENGSPLLKDSCTVLTHCNAGALATCGYGTALSVIRVAREQGKQIRVFADETRPYLQGARLTAWELQQDGIPVTLICDNMAGHFMKSGDIQCVIVGADRIARNGDTANKIGTYSVAVLARENGIPFYVAAPSSTIDASMATGDSIPIEERSPEEVTHIRGIRIAPEGIDVRNPAFDVTPARYISGIITEKGIVYPPFEENFRKLDLITA